MAWYIAIHDHDNPVSQHGLASYVTKFESQSFRLRSKVGVAFAQQESCWRSRPVEVNHVRANMEQRWVSAEDFMSYVDPSLTDLQIQLVIRRLMRQAYIKAM